MSLMLKAPELEPFSFVYTTCPTLGIARLLGRNLVDCRYAACVNIFDNVVSIYSDEGVCEASEVILLIKTTQNCRDKVIDFLEKKHPYKTAAILTWDAEANIPFVTWMKNHTKS